MQSTGQTNYRRKEITYFDGLNSIVANNIAKKEELMHCENIRSPFIGTIEKREGMSQLGDTLTITGNQGVFYFSNAGTNNTGLYKSSRVAATNTLYYLNSNTGNWTALAGSGTGFTTPVDTWDITVAEGNLYLVDRNNTTRYVKGSDGTTVVVPGTVDANNNVVRCPNASLINYYKGRLYVADYLVGSNRMKNSILRSSQPVGLLALANEDDLTGAAATLKITDTKYVLPNEVIDVYRAGNLIKTITVTSVQETTITITHGNASGIHSADELWVANTYSDPTKKTFRWVVNPGYGGVAVKDYDSFKLAATSDGSGEEIKMLSNIGNVMMIASNSNIGIWNDLTLRTLDIGIGSVSRKGSIKALGSMFFMHYTGVYQTEGDMPQLVSTKIERYITGASKAGLEGCVAGKKGRNIFFAIGDVTLRNPDGSIEKILKDVCLEYSIIQKNWYIHTNIKATSMTTYISSTDVEKLVMTTTFTNQPTVEFLATGIFTDFGGTEIPMRADTPRMQLGELFEKISYALEAIIEMERGNGLKVFISLDTGQWYEIKGEAEKGLTILKIIKNDMENETSARCRTIAVSLRHNGPSLCKVSKLAINYMISAEEEVDKEEQTRSLPNLT